MSDGLLRDTGNSAEMATTLDLCEAIAASIRAHDFEATSALMHRLALVDPVAAQSILDLTNTLAALQGETKPQDAKEM